MFQKDSPTCPICGHTASYGLATGCDDGTMRLTISNFNSPEDHEDDSLLPCHKVSVAAHVPEKIERDRFFGIIDRLTDEFIRIVERK